MTQSDVRDDGVRCAICGRFYRFAENPDVAARFAPRRHGEAVPPGRKPVFICDLCAGKVRYESEKEQKGTRPIG